MRAYFKYTSTGSFSLNGEPYVGYFNVDNNKTAYTGKVKNTTSQKLSSTDTFLSRCYINRLEFDNTIHGCHERGNSSSLQELEYSPRNIINKKLLKKNFDILHQNNLVLYALSQTTSPYLFDTYSLKPDTIAGYFGLSSTEDDLGITDTLSIKDIKKTLHIDTFARSKSTSLSGIDDINQSVSYLHDDYSFNLIATTSDGAYNIQGVLSGDAILDVNKINNGDLQNSIYISADKSKGVVNTVQKESDGLYITILDDTFLLNCDNVIILDKVKIPYENVISGSVRVSGDLIIYNRIDDKGDVFLESYDFKNETLKHSFNVSDIMDGDVTDHDIRSEDGMVIFIQGYSADLFYLYIIDGDYTSKDLPAPILINRYESAKFKGFKVFFSEHDSNVFYIVDDDVVTARYISQPHEPAKILDGFSLNLPPKISFLNACFPFSCGGPLEYKFDTNNTPGNDINISNITHINNNNSVFLMMHNQGRIYFKEIFPEADYLDLVSLYDETIDQGYSGLGLTVNNYLQKIVNDTLNLYTHTSKIPKGTLIKNIPVLTRVVRGVSPDINLRDFFTHSNESTNYVVLDRVLSKLYKLQKDYYELMCDVDRVVPDPNYGKLPERERPTYPLPTPELTAPKPTPTPTPLPVPTCPDRFTKPRYQIITTLVPGISSEETLLVEELVPVPPTVPPLPTPYKGPITIAPSPTPTPRPYVPPKVAPRIWISICDESSRASATTIQSQWNQFRKYEPQSKFLLIQPDGSADRLKIPVNWGSDANTGLFRGRTGGANRWFNWAKLGSYPQQTRVHIWFDTSGSNKTDRSSRNQLIDLCKQKGFIVSSNEDSNENWVAEPLRDALGYKTTGASAINVNNNIITAAKLVSSSLFGGITLRPPPVITYNVKPTTQILVEKALAVAFAAFALKK